MRGIRHGRTHSHIQILSLTRNIAKSFTAHNPPNIPENTKKYTSLKLPNLCKNGQKLSNLHQIPSECLQVTKIEVESLHAENKTFPGATRLFTFHVNLCEIQQHLLSPPHSAAQFLHSARNLAAKNGSSGGASQALSELHHWASLNFAIFPFPRSTSERCLVASRAAGLYDELQGTDTEWSLGFAVNCILSGARGRWGSSGNPLRVQDFR